jgi:hypothetical protein
MSIRILMSILCALFGAYADIAMVALYLLKHTYIIDITIDEKDPKQKYFKLLWCLI